MKERLLNNIGIKILSAVAAVILWVLVVNVEDYMVTKTISDIPITVVNEDSITELDKVYELDDDGVVSIIVKGRRSLVENLTAEDFVATADLSKLSLTNAVQIQVKLVNAIGGRQLSISCPENMVNVKLENRMEKQIQVTVRTEGEPAAGYAIGTRTTTPNMITISGAESLIKRVQSVQVTVDVSGASANVSTVEDLVFLNTDGERVSNKRLNANVTSVDASVEIVRTKEIPVFVETSGEVVTGYGVASVEYQPTAITIAGKQEDLDKIEKLEIKDLRVTGISEDSEFTIEVAKYLPSGIQVLEGMEQIMVHVLVETVIDRDISLRSSNITITGQNEVYTYAITNMDVGAVDVPVLQVRGIQSVIDALTVVDLNPIVDVTDLQQGEYDLDILYTEPDKVTVKCIGKVHVVVTAKNAITRGDTE